MKRFIFTLLAVSALVLTVCQASGRSYAGQTTTEALLSTEGVPLQELSLVEAPAAVYSDSICVQGAQPFCLAYFLPEAIYSFVPIIEIREDIIDAWNRNGQTDGRFAYVGRRKCYSSPLPISRINKHYKGKA